MIPEAFTGSVHGTPSVRDTDIHFKVTYMKTFVDK